MASPFSSRAFDDALLAPAAVGSAAPGRRTAAVCYSGWLGVSVHAGGESIRQNVLEPLEADLLFALTHHKNDQCSDSQSCGLARRFPALMPRLVALDLAPMLELGWLVHTMEALPHWPAILRAYGSKNRTWRQAPKHVRCERNPQWGTASNPVGSNAYKCANIYLGNTIFAPVLGSARLHVLRQLHDIRRCLTLIERREAATGVGYTRVVHSRLEDVWLRPHPPLSLLAETSAAGRDVMWVPTGEDYYGGLNDRHAVMGRRAADRYMSRWDYIVDGRVLQIDAQLATGRVASGVAAQDENFVRSLAAHFGIEVRRFAAVQYLGCCGASTSSDEVIKQGRHGVRSSCFSRACVVRAMPNDADAAGVCSSAAAAAAVHGGVGDAAAAMSKAAATTAAAALPLAPLYGKYRSEVEQAVHHAVALGLPGATWVEQPPPTHCPAELKRNLRRRATHCTASLGIGVPRQNEVGLGALLKRLKRRAFRGESPNVVWV